MRPERRHPDDDYIADQYLFFAFVDDVARNVYGDEKATEEAKLLAKAVLGITQAMEMLTARRRSPQRARGLNDTLNRKRELCLRLLAADITTKKEKDAVIRWLIEEANSSEQLDDITEALVHGELVSNPRLYR